MAIKPWYKIATPREDLREGRPLDASEFAVHLDHIREGRAAADYQKPELFFERTFLTRSLSSLAAEVIRRLSGEKTEASAVFNMATQFGGGKTHALTLLYHLARSGSKADGWQGVRKLLGQAGVRSVPKAATAVFVGTEFDVIKGRGGEGGTPHRSTPWGEIAFQLGGKSAFAKVAEHDERKIAPGGEVIRQFLPKKEPCLILLDELMNYVSRARKSGVSVQFYNFLQNLSEELRARDNAVLAVSIPASELEMTAEDQADYDRLKKLLDRIGKPIMMSAENETSEIIRRRLFEWDTSRVSTEDGRVLLPREAVQTCNEYADWVNEHRNQIPGWFPADNSREAFAASYPFHPMVLSVFERKWQTLPRFQRTRGILRLLALWVSHAYRKGFEGAHKDALIGIGTAPLEDTKFRAAMLEQLGEHLLEAVVTTDICGKPDSHATRLDEEALNGIKKARLHRKVATTIFFESNGGQPRADEATEPEIRLAVAEPDLDIGNIDTVLDSLVSSCYYLIQERKSYRFSITPNLNKILTDRRASIKREKIDERVRGEVRAVFRKGSASEWVYFPSKSNEIPDRPALTLVAAAPDQSIQEPKTMQAVESMTREYGNSARTFKSALVWCVADSPTSLYEEARKVLAWEDIKSDEGRLTLDEGQRRQLSENLTKSRSDLAEAVWRTYRHVLLLGKDNALRTIDLGIVHSSAADTITQLVLNRLRQDGELEDSISPNLLARKWPPAIGEWSTKSVRDVFFSSPEFPRISNPEIIKTTIAGGVTKGVFAYVEKAASGGYSRFHFNEVLSVQEVEISEEMFIVKRETAEAYRLAKESTKSGESKPAFPTGNLPQPHIGQPDYDQGQVDGREGDVDFVTVSTSAADESATKVVWWGEIAWQKWHQFYYKVLAKFAGQGLAVTVKFEVRTEGGISKHKVDEVRAALRELGLSDNIDILTEESAQNSD
ncbi:MAG: ATP-binding protein [Acidobacteria bacterium]|nr:ATP-binding protein [Acidobacteriota bacterium]